jgi:hypothetical protein
MNSVQTKVDMAIGYVNHLSNDLSVSDSVKFFMEQKMRVLESLETNRQLAFAREVNLKVQKEISNDRQGAGVPGDAAGTG